MNLLFHIDEFFIVVFVALFCTVWLTQLQFACVLSMMLLQPLFVWFVFLLAFRADVSLQELSETHADTANRAESYYQGPGPHSDLQKSTKKSKVSSMNSYC